ncbi:MAG TPA: metal ABC transporter permease [Deltaproteobacteria bacterium]|nr:metal ABC transporter permease [Deltaproteobacteria bacterium]
MTELACLYDIIPLILPFDCLQTRFMQQALVGLVLLAPLAAAMGVQVVNFRMAFFSDAISHSAFAGVALGLIVALDPQLTMLAFGVLVGLAIAVLQRLSTLSSDTVIGVIFAAVVAFGLAVVSRDQNVARDIQRFLYGDILTISDVQILGLLALFAVLTIFQAWGYNRLIYIGLNPTLAKAHRVPVAVYQYLFAALLALVVIFAVWAVGVLLVTALLIVPAAAGRNLARSAGAMFWWALVVAETSAVAGLIISAQDWARTATGATVILCAFAWFVLSAGAARWRNGR